MLIHNFFSDIALSIRSLFEEYIFYNKQEMFESVVPTKRSNFFKSFQFNLGNRNFQINDYKESGQMELPAFILNYVSDDDAFGREASLIGNHRIVTVNEILATHNTDTTTDLIVREEQVVVSFNGQINCESQLQANEIMHIVKRFLPVGKYIQIISFSTFLEIPPFFFTDANDPRRQHIENLYQKYEPSTGENSYFFLSKYKPIIRLNSITADVTDNSQRAYAVSLDFEYLIQLPVYLFSTRDEDLIDRINIDFHMDDSPTSIIVENDTINSDYSPKEINGIPVKIDSSHIIDYKDEAFKDNQLIIETPEKDNYIIEIDKPSREKSYVRGEKTSKSAVEENSNNSTTNIYNFTYIINHINDSQTITNNSNYQYASTASLYQTNVTNITNNTYNNVFNVPASNEIYNKDSSIPETVTKTLLQDQDYIFKNDEKTGKKELIVLTNGNKDLTPELNKPIVLKLYVPIENVELNIKKRKVFNKIYEIRPQATWSTE